MSDEPKSKNIHWHEAEVTQEQRETLLGQKGCVIWFTGLSGSGKSTIARRVEQKLLSRHIHAYSLDGDNVRHGLNKDLGFSPEDRTENIRRIGACRAAVRRRGYAITTASFISPYRAGRDAARELLPEGRFVEAWVNTSLEECEKPRSQEVCTRRLAPGIIPELHGNLGPLRGAC